MFKRIMVPLFSFVLFLLVIPATGSAVQSTVTPEQFGANGFDLKPDTEALKKALNSGADVVFLKDGASYIIEERLKVNRSIKIASGPKKATIIQKSDTQGVLYFRNPAKTAAAASQKITKGSSFITASNTAGIKAGDILELKSNKLWKWDNRGSLTKGEIHLVKSVSGKNIYFTSKTDDSYDSGKGEKVTVRTYSPNTIVLENINFTYPKPTAATAIIIDPSLNSSFKNISVQNSKLTGLKLVKNVKATVSQSSFKLGTTKEISTGYGVQDYGGLRNQITRSTFEEVRRGIDFSGDIPSRFGVADYNSATGPAKGTLAAGNSGFGTHSTAEYISFRNNTVKNFDYQFVSRGDYISFTNNSGSGQSKAFLHTNYGDHITLANNRYTSINKSSLDYFILRSSSFGGSIKQQGNKGLYRTFIK
ncbi:hypothetical protein LCL90_03035 [Bacillus infantis]|uniref:hypothetical protein n=1 Tax=Bacillus infantis TaxID=324767 RepID=UPI001CD4FC15|nr:hypothetical protein [Bacillus infantis]MCA1033595.1 hypothetical protein [Bacillus infantis]